MKSERIFLTYTRIPSFNSQHITAFTSCSNPLFMKPNKLTGQVLTLLVFWAFLPSIFAQNCEIQITSPNVGDPTAGMGIVSGNAVLPANSYLWVFAHKQDFTGWWPQGNGAAYLLDNQWDVSVFYGVQGETGLFEVIAIIVGEEAHKKLEKWVQEAPNTDPPYKPIALPEALENCASSVLIVKKTKD